MQVHDFRAGVRAWIDARGLELAVPLGDDSVDAQLHHQRRVLGSTAELHRVIGRQLVSAGTIPRLVDL